MAEKEQDDVPKEYPMGFYYIIKNARKNFFFCGEKITNDFIPKNHKKNLKNLTEEHNKVCENSEIKFPKGYSKIKVNGRFSYYFDGKKVTFSSIKDKKNIVDITEENIEKIKRKNENKKNFFTEIKHQFDKGFKSLEKILDEEEAKFQEITKKINDENADEVIKMEKIARETEKYSLKLEIINHIWKTCEKERKTKEERKKYHDFPGSAPKPSSSGYSGSYSSAPPPKPQTSESDEVRRRPYTTVQISDAKFLLNQLKITTKREWKMWLKNNHSDRNQKTNHELLGRVNAAAEIVFQNKS